MILQNTRCCVSSSTKCAQQQLQMFAASKLAPWVLSEQPFSAILMNNTETNVMVASADNVVIAPSWSYDYSYRAA